MVDLVRIASLLIIAFIVQVLFISNGNAATDNLAVYIAKFDSMDQTLQEGEGYSNYTNESGALAWGESYILEAYLDMYEGTKEQKFLAKFVRQTERILENTDQKRGLHDYKGRSVVGWGADRYSRNGERIIWLAHTSMITYPMARFAWLVNKYKLKKYKKTAEHYVGVAKVAMAFFDKNWFYDETADKSYYLFEEDEPQNDNSPKPPMPVPFNQQLAAGRTILMLYLVTGDKSYLIKSRSLAKHFKSNLQTGRDGSYSWNYWYGKGYDKYKAVEDVSHGAIDVDFAILAYRSGIVFEKQDMYSFLQTFNNKISQKGNFADKVDGTGANTYKDSIGRWLELAGFDCRPWNDYAELLSKGGAVNQVLAMLGIAKVVKYYAECGYNNSIENKINK